MQPTTEDGGNEAEFGLLCCNAGDWYSSTLYSSAAFLTSSGILVSLVPRL